MGADRWTLQRHQRERHPRLLQREIRQPSGKLCKIALGGEGVVFVDDQARSASTRHLGFMP